MTTQPGIFSLGTPEHCYLELDLEPGRSADDLVRGVAGLTGPLSSVGGVNVVVGFRPELWAEVSPADAPADADRPTAPALPRHPRRPRPPLKRQPVTNTHSLLPSGSRKYAP